MKKISLASVILISALLLLNFCVLNTQDAKADGEVLVSVVPSGVKVSPGDSFTVDVIVNPQGVDILSIQTNFEFDSSLVQVDSVMLNPSITDINDFFPFSNPGIINNSSGVVNSVLAFPLDPLLEGLPFPSTTFTLLTINLTAKTDVSGISYLRLPNTNYSDPTNSLIFTSSAYEALPYILTDGSIIVSGDDISPSSVSDLTVSSVTTNSAVLTWTAPGDDGDTGTAASYDIRYSTSNISNETDWNNATQATGEPDPSSAGTEETMTINGLDSGTKYYFAIKTSDEVLNESDISIVASKTTLSLDVTAPVITINGTNPVNINRGSVYTDAGAEAIDDIDGDITESIIVGGNVDVNTIGTYIITYNVSDNAGNPAVEVTRTVNVINNIPIIQSVTITPDPSYTDSTLTANPVFTDYDGDDVSFTYQWHKNGTDINGAKNSTLKSNKFDKNDVITVTVVPNDGTDYGVPVTSNELTISNSVPSQPTVSVTDPVYDSTDIICSHSDSTDVDGDTVTYTYLWKKDGVDQGISTNTVDNSLTTVGEVWMCVIIPSDGTDDGIAGENSVTILGDQDTISPDDIDDLEVVLVSENSAVLTWTAPGDDNDTGTAASYDIRYSTSNISNETDWNNATQATGEPDPSSAGTEETMTINGLDSGTKYYFAIKTSDEIPNESGLSNIAKLKNKFNLSIKDKSNNVINGAKVEIYDDSTDEKLHEFEFGDLNSSEEINIENGKNSNIKYILPTGEILILNNIVLVENTTINPQFVDEYSGDIPDGIETKSTVVALYDENLVYDSASITFLINDNSVNKILHCVEWDFNLSNCANWEIKPLSDYTYVINGLLLTISVTEFDAYMAGSSDDISPASVSDLTVSSVTTNSAVLTWTAPGDDGDTGTAASYDIRYSTSNISNETDWNNATQATGEPDPSSAGTEETMTINGLDSGTKYYFAIKTSDEIPNESGLSNVISVTTSSFSSGGSGGGGYVYNDKTSPKKVKSLNIKDKIQKGIGAELLWENPNDIDFSKVIIIRKEKEYPKNSNDGLKVYEGKDNKFSDNGVKEGIVYYYNVYSYDNSGNESDPAKRVFITNKSLIRKNGGYKVYVVNNNKKQWITTLKEFIDGGYKWENVYSLVKEDIDSLETGENIEDQITYNLIIAKNGHKVYVVKGNKKLWIPTVEAFEKNGYKWEDVVEVDENEMNSYTDIKIIKEAGNPKVYYIYSEISMKRWIPTPEIFLSYDNKWEDIETVSKTELDIYSDIKLIRKIGDYKVYYLENNVKRHIKSQNVFNSKGFKWNNVVGVNEIEFNFYETGEELK